jgi:hypothetical protein
MCMAFSCFAASGTGTGHEIVVGSAYFPVQFVDWDCILKHNNLHSHEQFLRAVQKVDVTLLCQ